MADLTIEQAFQVAIQHLQLGRLTEAEALYRQILVRHPTHAGALNHLGVIASRMGRNDIAVQLIRQAIVAMPNYADAYSNLAVVLTNAGKGDEAIAACRRAISLWPGLAEAHNNLGHAHSSTGQLEEAIAAYRQALTLKPNSPEFLNNLGGALRGRGQLDEAIAAFRAAVSLRPGYADAQAALGNALVEKGQIGEAIAAYRSALKSKPTYFEAAANLGNALQLIHQFEEAIAVYQHAVTLNANSFEAYNNLGNALSANDRQEEAVSAYRHAISLKQDFSIAYCNLGATLRTLGRFDESAIALNEALQLTPDLPEARWNLAMILLLRGDFQHGFEEYEWRFKLKDQAASRRNFSQPQWNGEDFTGRTVLLHAEQGMGDTLQFIRYVPAVAERGSRVLILCPPELIRLLRSNDSLGQVISTDEFLPAFDLHCPLLSLPRIVGTEVTSIPASIPYLKSDPALVKTWQQRLGDFPGLRVGVLWAGNPGFKNDRNRSLSLKHLAPLASIPGVRFYSLQKGPAAAQAQCPPDGMDLIDLAPELHDFADTASVISLLDLVIAPDTSVPHLAGALGKAVWLLLQFSPDWRWMLEREDSPWYPTMRLFRQKTPGDWPEAIQRVAKALADLRPHCPA